jgi:hypothetical protein
VALLERLGEVAELVEVHGLEPRPGFSATDARTGAGEEVLERAVASVPVAHRAREALERGLLRQGRERLRRQERGREEDVREARPAEETQPPRRQVELEDRPRDAFRGRSDRLVPGRELVLLLGRKAERVHQRPAKRLGRDVGVGHEAADALRILEQLLGAHLEAREVRPPRGSRLAAVVFEERAGEPAGRAGLLAFGELEAQAVAGLDPLAGFLRQLPRTGGLGPRQPARALPAEPVEERERGAAVLFVAGGDALEERVVASRPPGLVVDDRVRAGGQLGAALEAGEPFRLLQRVARNARAERLAKHGVEVDEHAAAQEVVDLVLPSPVLTHQALEGGRVVGPVVVDVEARPARQAPAHPVDDLLEGAALALGVVGPERDVRPVQLEETEQEDEPPARLPERVALEVENHVSRRGRRQAVEAAAFLELARPPEEAPALGALHLERRLLAQPRERRGGELRDPQVGGRGRERP